MNAAIVLLVVCVAAVEVRAGPRGHHGPHGDKMKKIMDDCMASTGADMESIKAAKSGEGVADEKVKCFSGCMSKKMGTMNEDNSINKEKLNQMAMHAPEENREEVKAAFEKCGEITGDGECDIGYQLFTCMQPFMRMGRHHQRQSRE